MFFKKKETSILVDTFTKKMMVELVRITELEVFLCFIMPFLGITPPENLAGILVVQILGVFVAYSIKSYKETKSEEDAKLIREGYQIPSTSKKTNNILKAFSKTNDESSTETYTTESPDTADEVDGEVWSNGSGEDSETITSSVENNVNDIISNVSESIQPLIDKSGIGGSIFKGLNKSLKK